MAALASCPAVEAMEGETHKTLTVHPIRYDTFAKVMLRFDRRYERSIQLSPDQLAAHIQHCTAVLNLIRKGA